MNLKNLFRSRYWNKFARPAARRTTLGVQQLEDRTTPTTTVFLDFGEGFVDGRLQTDTLEVQAALDDGGFDGPDFTPPIIGLPADPAITDGENLFMRSLRRLMTEPNFQVDVNDDGLFDDADYTQLRDGVVSLVSRQFEPFDVDVRVAASRNASDVRATLERNNGSSTGHADAYVFITGVFRNFGVQAGQSMELYGLASGTDMWPYVISGDTENEADESALVFAESVISDFRAGPSGSLVTWLGNVASHEAGHTFGLWHIRNDAFTQSELMRDGLSSPHARSFFSRIGYTGSEKIPGLEVPIYDDINPYDWMASDSDIGPRAGSAAYVTGTGEADAIYITREGDRARVEVYVRQYYIERIENYTVSLTNGILVEAGMGDDAIYIDASLGATVRVVGGYGTDRLIVRGTGTSTGTYTPDSKTTRTIDAQTSFGGTIVSGGTRITFEEFETGGDVAAEDFSRFTLITPGAIDTVQISGAVGPNGGNVVSGTSSGVAFVPVWVRDVATFVLDTGTNDTASGSADRVTLLEPGLIAPGLTAFTVQTGRGDDTLFVRSATLASPDRGRLTFDGGPNNDRIEASFDRDYTLRSNSLGIGGQSMTLVSVDEARLTGGAGGNSLAVSDFRGTVWYDGQGGADMVTSSYGGSAVLTTELVSELFSMADTVTYSGGRLHVHRAENLALNSDLGTSRNTVTIDNANFFGPDRVQTLMVNTYSGDDQVELANTKAAVTINTYDGRDTVIVRNTPVAALTINTGTEADTIELGTTSNTLGGTPSAWAGLTLNPGSGEDHVVIYDRNNPYTGGRYNGLYDIDGTGVWRYVEGFAGGAVFPIRHGVNTGGAERVTLYAGNRSDTINIHRSGVTVNAGDGADVVHVSPTARNLASTASVTVNGQGGTGDQLFLYDENNPDPTVAPPEVYTMTDGSLSRLSTVPTLRAVGINYVSVETLTLNTAPGVNAFTILGTPGNTTINAGAGVNPFTVGSPDRGLDLVRGTLTLNAGPGANPLTVNDKNATNTSVRWYETTGYGGELGVNVMFARKITGRGITSLTLTTSEGRDSVKVTDAPVPTVLDTGASEDAIHIARISAPLTVNAGGGADAITVGAAPLGLDVVGAALVVNGQDGADTLTLDDSAFAERGEYTIRAGSVTAGAWPTVRTPRVVTFATVDRVVLKGGVQGDYFLLESTAAGTPVEIQGGTGSDVIRGPAASTTFDITGTNAGEIRGPGLAANVAFGAVESLVGYGPEDRFVVRQGAGVTTHIDGHNGNDVLDYSDWTTPVVVSLPGGWATGAGGGKMSVVSFETVIGGSADDTLLGNARAGYATVLDGGKGHDVLVGGPASDTLLGGDGGDILIGGLGKDTLDGGAGDDVLVGGATAWDANLPVLVEMRALWVAADAYPVRVEDLRAYLSPGTAADDGAVDSLTGGGDRDWFWGLPIEVLDRDPFLELVG